MRLNQPFLKLPIEFDANALAKEVRALPPSAWVPHPTGFKGNEAVRLVTPGGGENDDLEGQMAATKHLLASPYIMRIMGEIGAVWGRSRLMGLGPGGEVPLHVDSHYYWRTHWRIHIPVITSPVVTFSCASETKHMAAGECWLFDSFRWHRVQNPSDQQRIHLVLDTVGGGRLRELIRAAGTRSTAPEKIGPGGAAKCLMFERMNTPQVMSPWELRAHLDFLLGEAKPDAKLGKVIAKLDEFAEDWASAWAAFGAEQDGMPAYIELIEGLKSDLTAIGGGGIVLNNRLQLYLALDHMVLLNLVRTEENAAISRQRAAVA